MLHFLKILFARLDVKEVLVIAEELQKAQAAEYAKEMGLPVEEEKEEEVVIDIEAKPEIEYDDFERG